MYPPSCSAFYTRNYSSKWKVIYTNPWLVIPIHPCPLPSIRYLRYGFSSHILLCCDMCAPSFINLVVTSILFYQSNCNFCLFYSIILICKLSILFVILSNLIVIIQAPFKAGVRRCKILNSSNFRLCWHRIWASHSGSCALRPRKSRHG